MGVFGRSWELTKTSFRIVKEEKELIVFPILSILFSLLLILAFAVPYLLSYFVSSFSSFAGWDVLHYILVFVIYFGIAFIATFFNLCVVYTAAIKFSKGDPKFGKTIGYAFSKVHLIVVWSLVSASVGLFLFLLERIAEKMKGVGGIIILIMRSLLGFAWSVSTIFVIPSMVYHNLGPFAAIKKSVQVLKKTWGELIIRGLGMGIVLFLFVVAGILVAVPLLIIFSGIGMIYAVIVFVLLIFYIITISIIFGVAGKVYDTALYVYAETGVVVGGYSEEVLKDAFKVKSKEKSF
jgi:hypothetical protein